VTIITNWIDRNDTNVRSFNNKYKFNLIYSKSRDGFDCITFHNKCNQKGPFIVLIKIQSKKIYGGYNPIGYASRKGEWLTTSDSFIFSFENDQDTHNMKIGRVINPNYSIYENYNGPLFSFGGYLYIDGNDKSNLYLYNSRNYNNILDNTNTCTCLPIEKIEVFGVVKNNSFT